MHNSRIFQISAKTFWGYQEKLDLDNFDTSTEIVDEIKKRLKNYLMNKNLLPLAEECDELDLCTMPIGKILVETTDKDIIYVCDHCHSECCNDNT